MNLATATRGQRRPGPAPALDFRAAILAPYSPAKPPAVSPEQRDLLFRLTDGDPARLDALLPPSLLAEAAVAIIRRGEPIAGDPIVLSAAAEARGVRPHTLRRHYRARIEYHPALARLRVVAGWRLYTAKVAYARARPDGRPHPEAGTRARLQAAVNQFAALAAEVTR